MHSMMVFMVWLTIDIGAADSSDDCICMNHANIKLIQLIIVYRANEFPWLIGDDDIIQSTELIIIKHLLIAHCKMIKDNS